MKGKVIRSLFLISFLLLLIVQFIPINVTAIGEPEVNLEFKDGENIVAGFSILEKSKYGMKILYIPRGPSFANANAFSFRGQAQDVDLISFVLTEIKQIAKKEKAFFIRISPAFKEEDQQIKTME